MKRETLLGCLAMAATVICAQTQTGKDSLQTIGLQGVEVLSIRATETTPVAYTNIDSKELERYNTGVDFPYLISMTPSAITTSDAGAGIGYTSIRVRGTDATRINVTANGIPINDAESHSVYWVNMPDFASSIKDVQIQRGVGTSTNGAGSFGASINLKTTKSSYKPYTRLNGTYGSFGTHKESIIFGTGLLKGHWSFDVRLSNIYSDGYIDRASSELKSYFMQGAYYGSNTTLRFITFAGKEETYHAWNYASKEEMEQYGRRYNSCGYMYTDENGVAHYYDNQTDNYIQKNYQFLTDHSFSDKISANIGLHYTDGYGYYQEYKSNRKLVEYALAPYTHNGETINKSDLVRQKLVDSRFVGTVFSLNYKDERVNMTFGGAVNHYSNDHYGKVLWVKNYIGELDANHEYYRNKGIKNDGNIYLKADYRFLEGVNGYLDMQYRRINYKIDGYNDKWNSVNDDGLQRLKIDEQFNFFNPKAGISWRINERNRIFGSYSIAHKEPTRNNYTDGKFYEHPKAEKLTDYELGYTYNNSWLHAGINLYYMDYKDQLVLTGELNEIGEAMADNVADSYRCGVELAAGVKSSFGLEWDINATFSRNRIKNFNETLYEYEDVSSAAWEINHGDTPIAFSPDIILNNIIGYEYKGLNVSLHSQYVGKQFMSNSKQEEHKLDAYFVSNMSLSYTFKLRDIKRITVGVNVYNIFNEEYENNGYAGSGFYFDNGEKVRYNYAGYAAQAGTNFLGHIAIEL